MFHYYIVHLKALCGGEQVLEATELLADTKDMFQVCCSPALCFDLHREREVIQDRQTNAVFRHL